MERKQPASSAKARQILNSTVHATSAAELFSAFDVPLSVAPVFDLDADIVACLKLLSKKDYHTKYKALRQLQGMIKDKPCETLKHAFSTFAPLCEDVVIEGADARVRETLALVLCEFVAILQKHATRMLPLVMPAWMLLMFDNAKTVRNAAVQGFGRAFKEDKRRLALQMCQKELVRLDEYTDMTRMGLATHLRVADDDANRDRLERLVCSALAAKAELIVALDSGDAISVKFMTHSAPIQHACVDAMMKVFTSRTPPPTLTHEVAKAALVLNEPHLRLKFVSFLAQYPNNDALFAPELASARAKLSPFLAKERHWSVASVERMAHIPWIEGEVMLPALFHVPEAYYTLLCTQDTDPVKALLPVRKYLDGDCPGLPRVLQKFAPRLQWDAWPQSAWESVDAYLSTAAVTARWIEMVAVLDRDLWQRRLCDVDYELIPRFLQSRKLSLTADELFARWPWRGDVDFLRVCAQYGASPEGAMKACPHHFAVVAQETDWDLTCFETLILDTAKRCDENDDARLLAVLQVDPSRAPFQKTLINVLVDTERWAVLCEYEHFSSADAVSLVERMGDAPATLLRQIIPLALVYPTARANAAILSQLASFDATFSCSKVPDVDVRAVKNSNARWFSGTNDEDFALATKLLHAGVALPSSFPVYEFCDHAWQNQQWDAVRLTGIKNLGRRFVSQLDDLRHPEDAFKFLSDLSLDGRTARFLSRTVRKKFRPVPIYLYASAAIEKPRAEIERVLATNALSEHPRTASSTCPVTIRASQSDTPVLQDAPSVHGTRIECASEAERVSSVVSGSVSRSYTPAYDDDSCPEITDDDWTDDDSDDGIDTWLVDVADDAALWRATCADLQRAHLCFTVTACECGVLGPDVLDKMWERAAMFLPDWQARRALRACPNAPAWELAVTFTEDLRCGSRVDCVEDLVDAATAEHASRVFLQAMAQPHLLEGPYKGASEKAYRKLGDRELFRAACCSASNLEIWTLLVELELTHATQHVLSVVRKAAEASGKDSDIAVSQISDTTPDDAVEAPVPERLSVKERALGFFLRCMEKVPFVRRSTEASDAESNSARQEENGTANALASTDIPVEERSAEDKSVGDRSSEGEAQAETQERAQAEGASSSGENSESDAPDRMEEVRERAREIVVLCMEHAPFSVVKEPAESLRVLRLRDDAEDAVWAARCLFVMWLLWPQIVRATFDQRSIERRLTLTMCKSFAGPLIRCAVEDAKKILVSGKPDGVGVKFRYVASARQATLSFQRDEMSADMTITFGEAFPLTAPKLTPPECGAGIPKARFRNWLMVCQNGVADGSMGPALLVWVRNMAFFFDGLEDCPICYSVVHAQTGAAPRKSCPTCKYKFHTECLYKWFRTSKKNTCPLCNQPI